MCHLCHLCRGLLTRPVLCTQNPIYRGEVAQAAQAAQNRTMYVRTDYSHVLASMVKSETIEGKRPILRKAANLEEG